MGCVSSKNATLVSGSPIPEFRDGPEAILASSLRYKSGHGLPVKREGDEEKDRRNDSKSVRLQSFRLSNVVKHVEGEQVSAGWPAWLSVVAAEAIHGWVPLTADSFEKLEKVGQGTYSSVFRARNLDTGKIFALKKVRFDNFEPESVKFMAREIQILRRLDHPNVVKLEGIITSRLSCSLYLVFEYMEHDLAGLSSSPDIKFSESQIKCYMKQLLSGLEHCHSRGVIHRDIKCANILVNNEGEVKMADFGLGNFYKPGQKQPLTSRVVTLWYRPPELLLGSTNYEESVDLWSVGCVFAEMFTGRPILQGRTEVEQLHKIFKLCGSPVDEYWKKSKLPHATIFKPHNRYESCLEETFKVLPSNAVDLLETLLSVEPYKRGTASTALASEYFKTRPYAADPSDLPKYSPSKEIDAKSRNDMRRRRISSRASGAEVTRPSRADVGPRLSCGLSKIADSREESLINASQMKKNDVKEDIPSVNGDNKLAIELQPIPMVNPQDESHNTKDSSPHGIAFSGPLPVSSSSGFAWAKRQREEQANGKYLSRRKDTTNFETAKINSDVSGGQENGDVHHTQTNGIGREKPDLTKILKKWSQLECQDSFDYSDNYHSQELSKGNPTATKPNIMEYKGQGEKFEFSGPLLSQSHKLEELLQKNEHHVRQAIRRSWLQKVTGRKPGK